MLENFHIVHIGGTERSSAEATPAHAGAKAEGVPALHDPRIAGVGRVV